MPTAHSADRVFVGGLCVDSLVDDGVVEGLVHEAALTAHVTLGLAGGSYTLEGTFFF